MFEQIQWIRNVNHDCGDNAWCSYAEFINETSRFAILHFRMHHKARRRAVSSAKISTTFHKDPCLSQHLSYDVAAECWKINAKNMQFLSKAYFPHMTSLISSTVEFEKWKIPNFCTTIPTSFKTLDSGTSFPPKDSLKLHRG